MSLKGLECQVSKSVNSDTCPRPTTCQPATLCRECCAACKASQIACLAYGFHTETVHNLRRRWRWPATALAWHGRSSARAGRSSRQRLRQRPRMMAAGHAARAPARARARAQLRARGQRQRLSPTLKLGTSWSWSRSRKRPLNGGASLLSHKYQPACDALCLAYPFVVPGINERLRSRLMASGRHTQLRQCLAATVQLDLRQKDLVRWCCRCVRHLFFFAI
jgi:hypothetical protein